MSFPRPNSYTQIRSELKESLLSTQDRLALADNSVIDIPQDEVNQRLEQLSLIIRNLKQTETHTAQDNKVDSMLYRSIFLCLACIGSLFVAIGDKETGSLFLGVTSLYLMFSAYSSCKKNKDFNASNYTFYENNQIELAKKLLQMDENPSSLLELIAKLEIAEKQLVNYKSTQLDDKQVSVSQSISTLILKPQINIQSPQTLSNAKSRVC